MEKKINTDFLTNFEKELNPQSPEKSKIPAQVIGYGEISSIFKIGEFPGWIYKRLPLFESKDQAKKYANSYDDYVINLRRAGINLPEDFYKIIRGKNKFVLYLAQKEILKENLCQNKLHSQTDEKNLKMLEKIFSEIRKIYDFNQNNKEKIDLSIDGQVSNWALEKEKLLYFDTSTPLFKINNVEQMNPELLLNSTPAALRWLIRAFFLQEVMDRYYDIRLVYIDLIANLYKEQKVDLIDSTLGEANNLLPENIEKIIRKEVEIYYKEDKFIWQLFLGLRRMDRWITNKILRRQYEYILPGKIKR